MSLRWTSTLLVGALAVAGPAEAQRVRELGLQLVGTASDPAHVTAGPFGGWRVSRRVRLSAAGLVGAADGELAWRGELLAHFLLAPRARRGIGWYGAAGLAAVGGPVDEGYLVVTLGAEAAPGRAAGWFIEAGVGGGARLALGFRWRK